MQDADTPVPPQWVAQQDGLVTPFDPDRISQSLFAAGESLGRPDAFLCRELTDSVVHFLAEETEGAVPTTQQIAELTIKVVRELGHPQLAAAYAARAAERARKAPAGTGAAEPAFADAMAAEARRFALARIYSRDVAAVHADSLLVLPGLERPLDLAAAILDLHKLPDLEEGLLALCDGHRRRRGGQVVLDSPEHLLAPAWPAHKPSARAFARRLRSGLALASLRAVVNLHAEEPPAWAAEAVSGPLFRTGRSAGPEVRDEQADELAREWCAETNSPVRVDWHLTARDFEPGSLAHERLGRRLQEAVQGANLSFVFDRTGQPVDLGEGVTRRRPAILLHVGLDLPRLAEQAGVGRDLERLLPRLANLARLGLSSGAQKREFLRRAARQHGDAGSDLTAGFLLDRAALVVAPVGLDRLVESIVGEGMAAGGAALEMGRRLLTRIRDTLRQHARGVYPEACVDGPGDLRFDADRDGVWESGRIAGLTPWSPSAAPLQQLRAAGVLHGVANAGTMPLLLGEDLRPTLTEVTELLHHAWSRTDIVRLRFLRPLNRQNPLPFGE
jgi:hypothetical protein